MSMRTRYTIDSHTTIANHSRAQPQMVTEPQPKHAPSEDARVSSTNHKEVLTNLPPQSLAKLARQIATQGPVKVLPSIKRIRLLINGAVIVDTWEALYVWEHDYYPQYYLPMETFVQPKGFEVKLKHGEAVKDDKGFIIAGGLELAIRRENTKEEFRIVNEMVLFAEDLEGPARMLRSFVRVTFSVVDQWFEEDTPIYVHPRDPFKRIDTLIATCPIRISLKGTTLAEAPYSVHLHEPLLPVRYYVPYLSIRTTYLRSSETTSECPYKGVANYHHVVVDGNEYKDLVWWYRATTREASMVEGLRCFYNEKVDIQLWDSSTAQWVMQQR